MDYLASASVFKKEDMIPAIPDPSVNGVYKVKHYCGKGGCKTYGTKNPKEIIHSIVYLKGYMRPAGDIRNSNDFETEDPSYKNESINEEKHTNKDDDLALEYDEDYGCGISFAEKAIRATYTAGLPRSAAKEWCKNKKIPDIKKEKDEPIKSCWGCGKDWHGTRDGKREGNSYLSKYKGKLMCPPCIEEYDQINGEK